MGTYWKVFDTRFLKMGKREADKNRKSDFCFCASAMAPYTGAEALRTMVDWLNWVCICSRAQTYYLFPVSL